MSVGTDLKLTPFRRVLIANRGEIALRVMRTARRLGLETVAVYSDADRDSIHTRVADQAVCIGGTIARQSYLKISSILEAARVSGADAVHPGYGFLAENAEFAAACRAHGLIFIGPSADSVRAMGDKAAAKLRMQSAGVPCVPGYQGEDQSESRLAGEAERIGYPVMVKAVAGGGGRGMRLVHDAGDFPELLRSAKSEAKSAFGNADVLLERAIVDPRHVEIQVFGDRYGNAIHLGERDCSVQRRHQKVIEEAPCPILTLETRERMGKVATNAVRALGYEGAGTLEFLLDPQGEFYFMEMNTRLQVEHTVTELITGLDLVELQLRVAAGERLPLSQTDVCFNGHAIEVRLCAEDETRDFLPQAGRIVYWQTPAELRVEAAVESGTSIPPYYDSMIAKLIAHGPDREVARKKLIQGLSNLKVIGIATNRGFLRRSLKHPVFASGEATTAFISKHRRELEPVADWSKEEQGAAALALFTSRNSSGISDLGHKFPYAMRFRINGVSYEAKLIGVGKNNFDVSIEDWGSRFNIVSSTSAKIELEIAGRRLKYDLEWSQSRLYFDLRDEAVIVEDMTFAPQARLAERSDGTVRASMGGRVISLSVKPGDSVDLGATLLVLEAMKMEHTHRAPRDGVVQGINVSVGDHVPLGAVLVQMAPMSTPT